MRSHITSISNVISKKVSDRLSHGKPVYRMDIGQPSTPAPKIALNALSSYDDTKKSSYSESIGITELRKRIVKHYKDEYQIILSKESIACSIGASQALVMICLACLESTETIAIGLPCYPAYKDIFTFSGLKTHFFSKNIQDDFKCTPEDIHQFPSHVKALLITNPSNPTGSAYSKEELLQLHEACQQKNIFLISDEIYHGIIYDDFSTYSMAGMENTAVINSFSKYYSMPGWRLGWIVADPLIISRISNIARSLYICPPVASQVVGLYAMDAKIELDTHVKKYSQNRKEVLKLSSTGLLDRYVFPKGAFYFYAHVIDLTQDSTSMCALLLDQTGVCVSPGTPFDPINGHEYVRISYAGDSHTLKEGLDIFANWLHNYRKSL